MHLVGCTPTTGLWGLWNNHFTVIFVTAGQQSYTDSAESLRRAPVACNIHSCPLGVLLRTCLCTVDLWSVQAWKHFTLIQPPFLSWRLSSVCAHLHLLMCVCDFLTSVFCICCWLVNCKLIGLDTLLSSSFITLHQLFLSLPLVPLCNGTKALLGMAWHLLAHFVPSSFYVESFGKKLIWVSFSFIYFYDFLSGFFKRMLV